MQPSESAADPSSPTRVVAGIDELADYLRRRYPHAAVDTDADQSRVLLTTDALGLPGRMAVIWQPRHLLVQYLYPLPFDIDEQALTVVADAVVRVNHALLLPGLGLDHSSRHAYYRLVAPRLADGSLSTTDVDRWIAAVLSTSHDFLGPLREVASGITAPADILLRARATADRPS